MASNGLLQVTPNHGPHNSRSTHTSAIEIDVPISTLEVHFEDSCVFATFL